MALDFEGEIQIDQRTGAVTGATASERMALSMVRLTGSVLENFHGFGHSYAVRAARKMFPSRKAMVIRLNDDSQLRTDYCDAYWSSLIVNGYEYEPWTHKLIADSRDVDYGFIDGGANHGYWSIMVTSAAAGSKKAVAIEAASDTFEYLADNRHLNGDRFPAINNAIAAVGGEHVKIYGFKHESRSIVAADENDKPILDCMSISLDEVAAMDEFAGIDKFIVKLDVEGVEVAAFEGAQKLQAGDAVFIVEDHGSDRSHSVTRHLLGELRMRVFWLGEKPGQMKEIKSVDVLDSIKTGRRIGYDMVATKSPFWLARLERLVGAQGRA
jgi:FkbM family methyltransferase